MSANGVEVIAIGQNNGFRAIRKALARYNSQHVTAIFIVNAAGRISRGDNPQIASTARYPDAPPWPTDEYRVAMIVIKTRSSHKYWISLVN